MAEIQSDLLQRAERAAVLYLTDTRRTPGGVDKTKSRAEKSRESAMLAMWTEAVWIANGRKHTPDYWRTRIVKRAQSNAVS